MDESVSQKDDGRPPSWVKGENDDIVLQDEPFATNKGQSAAYRPVPQGDMTESSTGRGARRGLGIIAAENSSRHHRTMSVQSLPRVPVGTKSPRTPGSTDPLLSPQATFQFPSMTSPGREDRVESFSPRPGLFKHRTTPSSNSNMSFEMSSPELDFGQFTPATAYKSASNGFSPEISCPNSRPFHQGRKHWLSISVLVLSLYSTILSGIFFVIATVGPRYGRSVRSNGPMSPSSASLLASFFAKTIEVSFITVIVAFLGQVLSRRAFQKGEAKGVTLAQLNMRNWIIQPGTMFTNWETVRYASLSTLGVIALVATFVGTLYTTAADALVKPQLKYGRWEDRDLLGLVKTSFANPGFIAENCPSPIRTDPEYGGTTCLQMQHAAQGFHNYRRFLSDWNDVANAGNDTRDLKTRPPGFGLLYENTSVTPAWVEVIEVEENYKTYDRIINNVSMAMPHPGVVQAAHDPRNRLMQPEELDGLGTYSIHASVPSPVLHVLCANMMRSELAPLVYEEWPDAETPVNITLWPSQAPRYEEGQYFNQTVVDDVFGWGESYQQVHPVFPRYPIEYNTILNHSGVWGRESIYLLGKGGTVGADDYLLCSMRVSISPFCSTDFTTHVSGGNLQAHCEDIYDPLAFYRTAESPKSGKAAMEYDWVEIAREWGNAVALNTGISDANASNARLLTQLRLETPQLNPVLPSPAEALAVMAGSTLLMSAQDTTFYESYEYENTTLDPGVYEVFKASIRAQQYASGGVFRYQLTFHFIITLVFVMNLGVLIYYIYHNGLVTDFSEPPNLFSLAINSPPSQLLAGSCGGGPQKEQFNVNWIVKEEDNHFYVEGQKDMYGRVRARDSRASWNESVQRLLASPVSSVYSKFSKGKSSL